MPEEKDMFESTTTKKVEPPQAEEVAPIAVNKVTLNYNIRAYTNILIETETVADAFRILDKLDERTDQKETETPPPAPEVTVKPTPVVAPVVPVVVVAPPVAAEPLPEDAHVEKCPDCGELVMRIQNPGLSAKGKRKPDFKCTCKRVGYANVSGKTGETFVSWLPKTEYKG